MQEGTWVPSTTRNTVASSALVIALGIKAAHASFRRLPIADQNVTTN